MDIQLKRGQEANRLSVTPKVGEPLFTHDEKELYIGDGTTAGGIAVGTVKPTGTIVANTLAVFTDASGKLLKSLAVSEVIKGLATETFVNQRITAAVPGIVSNRAKLADTATNASKLNNRSDYLTPDLITTSFQENSPSKIVAASGVKALYDNMVSLLKGKVSTSAISNSLNSTAAGQVASISTIKTLKGLIDALSSTVGGHTSSINSNTSSIRQNASKISSLSTHLSRLPGRMTSGTGNPSGGSSGDVYIQYK